MAARSQPGPAARDATRAEFLPLLAEARRLTGADAGAAVFLDAGQGLLELVAADGDGLPPGLGAAVPRAPLWQRREAASTMLVPVPDRQDRKSVV